MSPLGYPKLHPVVAAILFVVILVAMLTIGGGLVIVDGQEVDEIRRATNQP